MLKNKLWTSCGTGKASCNSVSSHETFKKYIKLVNKPSQWSVSVKFLLSHWKISTLQKQQTRRDTSHAHQAARANFDSLPSVQLCRHAATVQNCHGNKQQNLKHFISLRKKCPDPSWLGSMHERLGDHFRGTVFVPFIILLGWTTPYTSSRVWRPLTRI
jgi:hypothetical protein